MTIDTNITEITSAIIQPVKVKFNDVADSTRLGVKIIFDDLTSTTRLVYVLMDAKANIYLSGNATITGASYQNWAGNNNYPFEFVADMIGVVFA